MPIEVFLPGTWQLTQDEVLIAMWPSYAAIAPEPSVADSRSGSAVTTGTPAGMPVAAAAESSTVPTTDPVGTNGGSWSVVMPAIATSAGS